MWHLDGGECGRHLINSTTNQILFQNGNKDIFKISLINKQNKLNIGGINKISISHIGSGPAASWYCKGIKIIDLANKKSI